MFIPLYDVNPLRTIHRPYVTYALMLATIASFVLFKSGLMVSGGDAASAAAFGVIPAEFHQHAGLRDTFALVPEPFTFITYQFVHGGWMHLIGNMLFLWVFGDNVEDAMGHLRFLLFYLLAGIGAALAHATASPLSDVPLVGASGSIAGVVAAYLILHPRVKVWVLLLMRLPIKISAVWAIGGWLVFQFVMLVAGGDHSTAWWAHIGGFATGAVLLPVMRRPGVPLFDRGLTAPQVRTLR
jgi:membrane associated rhomboid family serine protease